MVTNSTDGKVKAPTAKAKAAAEAEAKAAEARVAELTAYAAKGKAIRAGLGGGNGGALPTYPAVKALRREPKANTLRALIIPLLLDGATLDEVKAVTGWNTRQAREGVRLLHYKCGYGIETDDNARITIYGEPKPVAPEGNAPKAK